jgi:hypothetical protein
METEKGFCKAVEEVKKEENLVTKRSYKKEKVCEELVAYDPGYMYYLDKRGNVYRSPRSVGQKRLRRREKVLELNIDKKPNHLYYVNNKGEIWCVEMNRGGIKGVKYSREKVLEFRINKKPNHLYYINEKGKIWCVETNRGGIKDVKHKRLYFTEEKKEEIAKLYLDLYDEYEELVLKNIKENNSSYSDKEKISTVLDTMEEKYNFLDEVVQEDDKKGYGKYANKSEYYEYRTDVLQRWYKRKRNRQEKANIEKLVQKEKTDDINEDFKRYLASFGAKIV